MALLNGIGIGTGWSRGSGGAGADTSILANLVSYWKMDEASGVRDDAQGTFDLADNNTVASAAGKIGTAALFASANSEWLSNASFAPVLTNAFSISLWVKFTTIIAGNYTLANWWNYGSDGCFMVRYNGSNDTIVGYIVSPAADPGNQSAVTSAAISAATATWYHLCVIYNGAGSTDSDKLKVYWNGTNKALTYSGTFPATLRNPSVPFELGRFGSLAVDYLNGSLDEVAFWKRALSGDEVTSLYNAGAGMALPI